MSVWLGHLRLLRLRRRQEASASMLIPIFILAYITIVMCKVDLIIIAIGTLALVFNAHHVNGLVFDSTREGPGSEQERGGPRQHVREEEVGGG